MCVCERERHTRERNERQAERQTGREGGRETGGVRVCACVCTCVCDSAVSIIELSQCGTHVPNFQSLFLYMHRQQLYTLRSLVLVGKHDGNEERTSRSKSAERGKISQCSGCCMDSKNLDTPKVGT